MNVYGDNWMIKAALGEAAAHLVFGGGCALIVFSSGYEKVQESAPSLFVVCNLTIFYCLFAALRALITLLVVTIIQSKTPHEPQQHFMKASVFCWLAQVLFVMGVSVYACFVLSDNYAVAKKDPLVMKWWLFVLIVSTVLSCLLACVGLGVCTSTVSSLMTPYMHYVYADLRCKFCGEDFELEQNVCQLWCSGGCVVHVHCFKMHEDIGERNNNILCINCRETKEMAFKAKQ